MEIMGRRRFRIQQAWEQDGYRVARPAFFTDSAPASAEEEHALVQQTSSVDSLADQWTQRLRCCPLVPGAHAAPLPGFTAGQWSMLKAQSHRRSPKSQHSVISAAGRFEVSLYLHESISSVFAWDPCSLLGMV